MKHADELRALGEFLRDEKAEAFDMYRWRDEDNAARCGFAGCAIGHLPEACPDTGITFTKLSYAGNCVPYYDGKVDFGAVALYFGITKEKAYYLFDGNRYLHPSQHEVGQRILGFLEEHHEAR